MLVNVEETVRRLMMNLLSHDRDAVAALNVLGGILASGEVDSSHDVGGVCVETTNAASHGRTDQVLADVELDESINVTLEDGPDDLAGDDSLGDDTLATAIDPVDSSRLLVRAVVARDSNDSHVLEAGLVRHNTQSVLDTLRDHVHSHGITSGGLETNVNVGASDSALDLLKTSEARSRIESILHDLLTRNAVEPKLGRSSARESLKANARTTSHAITSKNGDSSATGVDGLATTAHTGNEDTFGGSHGQEVATAVDNERASDTNGQRSVTNDVLAASSEYAVVVHVLVGQKRVLEFGSEVLGS